MPDLSSELAQLLSLIAHELRTPLSVTSGYLKMLSSGRPGPLNDAQTHAVGGASRSSELLTTLAADISLLGRLERGELTAQRTRVDLGPLVEQVAGTYTVHPDHPVTIQVAAGEPVSIQADAAHLRRTLSALLAAVVRAAPDDGEVRIGWRTVSGDGVAPTSDTETAPAAPAASTRVNGPEVLIGFALAHRLDALLEADASTLFPLDESQAGLGMSLPVVRRLIALDEGTILSARESQALSLRLTLPLRA